MALNFEDIACGLARQKCIKYLALSVSLVDTYFVVELAVVQKIAMRTSWIR